MTRIKKLANKPVRRAKGKRENKSFQADNEAWLASVQMVRRVWMLRGAAKPNPRPQEDPEVVITRFCSALRRSPQWITLARIVRGEKLSNDAIVGLVTAMTSWYTLDVKFESPHIVAMVVAGYDPLRIYRFHQMFERKVGLGRLVHVQNGHLIPSTYLGAWLNPAWSMEARAEYRRKIKNLPTSRKEGGKPYGKG